MGILRNLIKNIGIKGTCMAAKPFDGVCEIALGTAVDSMPERKNNKKIIVKSRLRSNNPKLRCFKRRFPREREDSIDTMIRNSARGTDNDFRNRYPQSAFFAERSRINEINEIENDIRKRNEEIMHQAGLIK